MCVMHIECFYIDSSINMEEEYNKYDALSSTIKIEEISSNVRNQEILCRFKENDQGLDNLWICNQDDFVGGFNFCPTITGRSWDGWDIILAKIQLWTG